MASATGTIEVDAPIKTVYNQWTQFEEFPRIMTGVEGVEQIDDKHLRWKENIGGREKEWTAEIVEQIPDSKIAWRSAEGDDAWGEVIFTEVDPQTTQIELSVGYEAEGIIEKGGSMLGVDKMRIQQDLQKFKDYLEERGQETGGWRGTIKSNN